jgi:hypothetical protein
LATLGEKVGFGVGKSVKMAGYTRVVKVLGEKK